MQQPQLERTASFSLCFTAACYLCQGGYFFSIPFVRLLVCLLLCPLSHKILNRFHSNFYLRCEKTNVNIAITLSFTEEHFYRQLFNYETQADVPLWSFDFAPFSPHNLENVFFLNPHNLANGLGLRKIVLQMQSLDCC